MKLMNQPSLIARSPVRTPAALVLPLLALAAAGADAGVSPGGLVSDASVNMTRTRAIMIDNEPPITRARGSQIDTFAYTSGSGHSYSDGFWYMGDSFYANNYHTEDVFEHRASGLLELSDLRDNERMQGLATQSMHHHAQIIGPVAYDLTIALTFDHADFVGEVDATFLYAANIIIFGGASPALINESNLIDLNETADGYLFIASGIINGNGGTASLTMNLDTTLSTVIDAPGEYSKVGYTMTTTLALHAIPAPSTTLALSLGLCATRRRR